MNVLSWKPGYSHDKVRKPPKSMLTVETGGAAYEKLKQYWAIEEHLNCPAAGWDRNGFGFHRHLFQKNGFHHAVIWMPELKAGWCRMTYEEFCNWYDLF